MMLIGIGVLAFGIFSGLKINRTPTKTQQAYLQSDEPTIVMFYSKTCPDCMKVGPYTKYANLITQGNHHMVYVAVQNKRDKQLFAQQNIHYVPTFMVFKDGQPQVIQDNNVYQYSGTDTQKIKYLFKHLTLNGYQN